MIENNRKLVGVPFFRIKKATLTNSLFRALTFPFNLMFAYRGRKDKYAMLLQGYVVNNNKQIVYWLLNNKVRANDLIVNKLTLLQRILQNYPNWEGEEDDFKYYITMLINFGTAKPIDKELTLSMVEIAKTKQITWIVEQYKNIYDFVT